MFSFLYNSRLSVLNSGFIDTLILNRSIRHQPLIMNSFSLSSSVSKHSNKWWPSALIFFFEFFKGEKKKSSGRRHLVLRLLLLPIYYLHQYNPALKFLYPSLIFSTYPDQKKILGSGLSLGRAISSFLCFPFLFRKNYLIGYFNDFLFHFSHFYTTA